MKTLTKILGVVAIGGALIGLGGYAVQKKVPLAIGATGFAVGGVGYIIAKSREDDKSKYK